MLLLNPLLRNLGYSYVPVCSLSCRLPAGCDISGLVQAMSLAGFLEDRIQIYTGSVGAERLGGRRNGVFVWFYRWLEDIFMDLAALYQRADVSMRLGGHVMVVATDGLEGDRRRAAEILKSYGGVDVVYWGSWVTEYL